MSEEISRFYDEYLTKREINYRLCGNIRIDAAVSLVLPYIKPNSRTIDIGCGIGILTEALAKHAPSATIFGVDISPATIEYARRTIGLSNVELFVASVTDEFSEIQRRAVPPFDVICMIDVIEHVPAARRTAIFHNLGKIAAPDAILILTYPSPEYQNYLRWNKPDELQIVDNVVEVPDLLSEAISAGWLPRFFSYIDVWYANQYIHVVLARSLALRPIRFTSRNSTLTRLIDRLLLKPRRIYKYKTKPFVNWPFK